MSNVGEFMGNVQEKKKRKTEGEREEREERREAVLKIK